MATRQTRGKATKKSAEPPLRILCFGDSLTCGYPIGNPYAGRLAEMIEEAFPGRRVECEVEGLPGDLVTNGEYMPRMERSWELAQHPFDWTIVLGGTNDLGWGRHAEPIIEGLKRLWDIPLSKGGKVLALTILETKGIFPTLTERRNNVNDAIRSYEKENFFHFDLFKELPYHAMAPEDRDKYWDPDGLHLQAAGYDLMGEKIGDALVRILRLAEAQGTDISSVVSDARQRKAIEDLIFEEEIGDPRLLSQGYIVVRKKDLD
ncbi:SGNH hydrolase-type esterase domain-containing protein [Ustulina deusta]|nr:SGNH hydrolase-type esterase domain-containing protein [Ustulina deusta]